jgi:hypothetical protein
MESLMEIQQENILEKCLRLAADEPAHRPEFLRVLLDSTVYVLGTTNAGAGTVNLEAGSEIEIHHWEQPDGTRVIPFFSSLEILQKSIDTEQSYLALPARSLFEMALDTNLILNPKSLYGKEFLPDEVRNLLSGSASRRPIRLTSEKERTVLLSQPAKYPQKMVDSLSLLLTKHHNVKRAFLAQMHAPPEVEKACLIVGIEGDGDIELVLREAGNVAADTAPDGEPVDLYRVSEDASGASNYLLTQTKPFYERKQGTTIEYPYKIRPRLLLRPAVILGALAIGLAYIAYHKVGYVCDDPNHALRYCTGRSHVAPLETSNIIFYWCGAAFFAVLGLASLGMLVLPASYVRLTERDISVPRLWRTPMVVPLSDIEQIKLKNLKFGLFSFNHNVLCIYHSGGQLQVWEERLPNDAAFKEIEKRLSDSVAGHGLPGQARQ